MRRLLSSTVLWLAAAIFALQFLSSGVAIWFLRAQMQGIVHADRTREVLDVRDDLLATYYDGGPAALRMQVSGRRGSVADPLIFVALTGRGAPLLSNIAAAPVGAPLHRPGAIQLAGTAGAPPTEGLAMATPLPDGTQLVVGAVAAAERGFDVAFAEAVGLTLALTVGLALMSATLIGLAISRRTHGIAETAEALGAGNFTARVPPGHVGDGFDHLRRQINLMADRIDQLVRQLQSVAGALAHDLQSPVARLRSAIDTALATELGVPAEEALLLARADAEALQSMLANALELSRLESGAIVDRRSMLDLGEVVTDLAELYEPLAEQSGVALSCDAEAVRVRIDRELMARALANLIDNALKYGGDRIEVTCRAEGREAVVTVSDNGPGIAEADRKRAVDRFTRLDNARVRPGAGLGLAMVSAVASLHGGSLDLSDRGDDGRQGLVARIRVPFA